MGRGRFIVIEGIDGSGKSTQAAMLADWLDSIDQPCARKCEPTNGPIGQIIRSQYGMLNESHPHWINDRCLGLLFAADRSHHCQEIEKLLAKGGHVVCDRYLLSNMVYNGPAFASDEPTEDSKARSGMRAVRRINSEAGALVPDLTIQLTLSLEKVQRRIRQRGEPQQRLEADLPGLHRRYVLVMGLYERWVGQGGGRYLALSGDGSPAVVHARITRAVISQFFPKEQP